MFKVAVLQDAESIDTASHPFFETRYVQFYATHDLDDAMHKLSRHKMDMLVELGDAPRYWVNIDAPRGYVIEKLLLQGDGSGIIRETVSGDAVRYIDWLLPGILGMNMMFSCLFGVGYVVVRYRKNGYLRRLQATPLTPLEFLIAQVMSRMVLTMSITIFVFIGTSYFIGFSMGGSYLSLLLVAMLGAISMIALGLVVASRVNSEELAGGLLNMITWPMMLLSGVWFSLEGTNSFMQGVSKIFPLTQMLGAARAIMFDGAGLADVMNQIIVLSVMTAIFLTIGSLLFRWDSK